MKVSVDGHVYSMTPAGWKKLLDVAKEQVHPGIYAVEKNGYGELRKDTFRSPVQLRKAISEWEADGFKVHYNKR